MAKEVGDLPLASALTGAEEIVIVQGGNSRRASLTTLAQWVKVAESIVPSSEPWRGALVKLSADLTAVNFPFIVPWGSAVEDTDAFWSVGTPTRLAIPAGITRVRLGCFIELEDAAAAGSIHVEFRKNGGATDPANIASCRYGATGFVQNRATIYSYPGVVIEGDYFEVRIYCSISGVDQVKAASRFWLEVVEATP